MEATHLQHWVEQRGGVCELNSSVWITTKFNPFSDSLYRNIESMDSYNLVGAELKIYAENEELELVKIGLNKLENIVGSLQP